MEVAANTVVSGNRRRVNNQIELQFDYAAEVKCRMLGFLNANNR